jgi:hypothetical protein
LPFLLKVELSASEYNKKKPPFWGRAVVDTKTY